MRSAEVGDARRGCEGIAAVTGVDVEHRRDVIRCGCDNAASLELRVAGDICFRWVEQFGARRRLDAFFHGSL